MSFYYQREAGPEGQIITGEGESPGLSLAALVESGPLPIRAALELVAYVADIVTVAEEDRAVHGDLAAESIRVDNSGAVSVDGYGVTRRGGRAPEGKSVGVATDVYGMGALLLTAISGESLGAVPRDRDGHDEAIVQRLLAVDWQHLAGKRWLEDLLRFLSAMFSFAPEERPQPLDVANVLNHVAGQAGGDDLMVWAARAVRAAGGTAGKKSTGTVVPVEDLGGPQALGAPMTGTAAFRIRQAASAKGESTAFWSRDRIAAMLAEEDEEDLQKPLRREWKPDESNRTRPRPVPEEKGGQRQGSPAQSSMPPVSLPPPVSQTPFAPPPPEPRVPQPPPRPPPPSPPPIASTGSPFVVQGPIASGPMASEPEPTENKSNILRYVLIGVVLLGILCAGGTGVGYLFWKKSQESVTTTTTETPPEAPKVETPPEPEVKVDTGKPTSAPSTTEPTEPAEPTTPPTTTTTTTTTTPTTTTSTAKTTTPTTSTKTTSTSSTSSTSSTKPSTKSTTSSTSSTSTKPSTKTTTKATTTTTSGGPSTVKFVVRDGEATLQCGDGQQATFVGTTRMTFSDVTTCRVKIGAALGVVQISQTTTYTCTADASNRVTCSAG